jgi:hypothetical protein
LDNAFSGSTIAPAFIKLQQPGFSLIERESDHWFNRMFENGLTPFYFTWDMRCEFRTQQEAQWLAP